MKSIVFTVAMHVFFLMIRRPPRSTLDRSSAASDVYKRQGVLGRSFFTVAAKTSPVILGIAMSVITTSNSSGAVSYTHLRAHETVLDLVCRLLLEKKTTILQI